MTVGTPRGPNLNDQIFSGQLLGRDRSTTQGGQA